MGQSLYTEQRITSILPASCWCIQEEVCQQADHSTLVVLYKIAPCIQPGKESRKKKEGFYFMHKNQQISISESRQLN